MKVLIIGSGGREHALVRSFRNSKSITEVHVIPGNDGMEPLAFCHKKFNWQDFASVSDFCKTNLIDFVFIGPEDPLVAGLADFLRDKNILVVGPNKDGAQLEGSKIFAKEFMTEAGVPTAPYVVVSSRDQTLHAAKNFTPPYVLKADGLAAGKGVFICTDLKELEHAAVELFEKKILGSAGTRALLEQSILGWELSYLVLTNGEKYETLPLAQDHKRLRDNDLGPNTGGMGTIAPLEINSSLRNAIEEKVIQPSIELIKKRKMIFRGVLFVGIMVDKSNHPQVLEYNTRFGDPETQVILPLIENDTGILFKDLAKGELQELKFNNQSACCVVLAAEGYPSNPRKGVEILGDLQRGTKQNYFIHAGTALSSVGGANADSLHWSTNGGRVLCSIGIAENKVESVKRAYQQFEGVSWPGMQFRKDIGSQTPG